jgi:hypothetical protein
MKSIYLQPHVDTVDVAPLQILCASGSGWAEMGGYGGNTGGGFSQDPPF